MRFGTRGREIGTSGRKNGDAGWHIGKIGDVSAVWLLNMIVPRSCSLQSYCGKPSLSLERSYTELRTFSCIPSRMKSFLFWRSRVHIQAQYLTTLLAEVFYLAASFW